MTNAAPSAGADPAPGGGDVASSGTPDRRPGADASTRRVTARAGRSDDAAALGAMFARAFAEDPVWAWMCRNRMRRFASLASPFFTAETRNHLAAGTVWTVPGADAGALWAAPGAWRSTVPDLARLAPGALRLFGPHLPRSLSALAAVDRVHPREPHWYLALLGTDPDHQGRGLGSAVLAPVLAVCDAEGTGAYLESSKESNLGFYARHGFEVTGTVRLGRGGPSMWTMWRDPHPPAS